MEETTKQPINKIMAHKRFSIQTQHSADAPVVIKINWIPIQKELQ